MRPLVPVCTVAELAAAAHSSWLACWQDFATPQRRGLVARGRFAELKSVASSPKNLQQPNSAAVPANPRFPSRNNSFRGTPIKTSWTFSRSGSQPSHHYQTRQVNQRRCFNSRLQIKHRHALHMRCMRKHVDHTGRGAAITGPVHEQTGIACQR